MKKVVLISSMGGTDENNPLNKLGEWEHPDLEAQGRGVPHRQQSLHIHHHPPWRPHR